MSFSGSDLGDTPPPMISPASIQSDSWANVEAAAVALEGTTAGDKDDFVSVKDERDRLRSRVFELENRLRETEEELEYFSNFYKKIKRENGGLASQAGASSGKQQSSSSSTTAKGASKYDDHATEQRTGEEKTQQPRSDCSDSDLEDGTAPINQNYAGESSVVAVRQQLLLVFVVCATGRAFIVGRVLADAHILNSNNSRRSSTEK